MIAAWRIAQAQYASFDGEGARRYGGRWNRRGIPMVYAAGSLSLAALELLVHLESSQLLQAYVCIPVAFEEALCLRFAPSDLPADWASYPAPDATRDLGSSWALSRASVALAVPSVIVPIETNYLLNPDHPDFSRLTIGDASAFEYDSRLIKRD